MSAPDIRQQDDTVRAMLERAEAWLAEKRAEGWTRTDLLEAYRERTTTTTEKDSS